MSSYGEAKKSASEQSTDLASELSTHLVPDNWKEIADMLSPDDVARLTVTGSNMHKVLEKSHQECEKDFLPATNGCSETYEPPKGCANSHEKLFKQHCGVVYHGGTRYRQDATITSVFVSRSVREIDDQAFYLCSALNSVRLFPTLKIIGAHAFNQCTNLQSVTLPEGLTNIGDYAFAGCGLRHVHLPETLEELGECAFGWCVYLVSATLPKSLKTVPESTFMSCHRLEHVELPEGIKTIGQNAFSGCLKLVSVTLPKSLKKIDWGAFKECRKLESIEFPEGIRKIGIRAFRGCGQLAQVHVPVGCRVSDDAFPDETTVIYTQPSLRAGYHAVPLRRTLLDLETAENTRFVNIRRAINQLLQAGGKSEHPFDDNDDDSESDFSGDSAYEYNSEEENKTYTVKEAYEHVLEFLSHKEEFHGDALKTILRADESLYDELEVSSKLEELLKKIPRLVKQINTLNETINNLRGRDIKDALPLLKSYSEEQKLLQKFLKESHHYTFEEVIESMQLLAKDTIMNRLEQRLTSLRDQRQEASTMLSVLERFEINKDVFFSTYTKQQERAALRAEAAERRKKRKLEARPETAEARPETAEARAKKRARVRMHS